MSDDDELTACKAAAEHALGAIGATVLEVVELLVTEHRNLQARYGEQTAELNALRAAYRDASGGKVATTPALMDAIHRGAR